MPAHPALRAAATTVVLAALIACAGTGSQRQDLPVSHAHPLTATGNEPGWRLELWRTRFSLLADYGEVALEGRTLPPQAVPGGTRHGLEAPDHEIHVVVLDHHCTDTMTGMPYPYTATLTFDGRELAGCAGDPSTLLHGDAWRLEAHGAAADTIAQLEFSEGAGLALRGPCNRFAGRYRLSGEGLSLQLAPLTAASCDNGDAAREQALLERLTEVYRFSIVDGDTLLLHLPGPGSISGRR